MKLIFIICLVLIYSMVACREKESPCAYAPPIFYFVGYELSEIDTVIMYTCEKGNFNKVLDSTIHTDVGKSGGDTVYMLHPNFTIGDLPGNSWIIKAPSNNRLYKFNITSSSLNSATERDQRRCASYMKAYTLDGVAFAPLLGIESRGVYLVK